MEKVLQKSQSNRLIEQKKIRMENNEAVAATTQIKYNKTSCYFCNEWFDNDSFKVNIVDLYRKCMQNNIHIMWNVNDSACLGYLYLFIVCCVSYPYILSLLHIFNFPEIRYCDQ